MTYRIALVACSAAKLDHPNKARYLYTSQLFRKAAELAERTADEWFILSAEHGLVHPDTILKPYDTKLTAGTATTWALRTNEQLQAELNRGGEFELVVYAGKHYRTALFGLPCPVVVPMQGLGIGQQLAYLTQAISEIDAPAVSDDELHALDRDQQASMLWYIRGWMSRPSANFDEALRYAYRDQLEAQARMQAYKAERGLL